MKDITLILFDGDCAFCNQSVQFILKNNKQQNIVFASLHKSVGKKVQLQYNIPDNLDSLILIENGQYYCKSTAVLRICKQLNWCYPLLYIFVLVPKPFRDFLYQIFANNRYRFIHHNDTCTLPSQEDRERFLD